VYTNDYVDNVELWPVHTVAQKVRLSHKSETVSLFCDSVDRPLGCFIERCNCQFLYR